jgi:hypothetical protein
MAKHKGQNQDEKLEKYLDAPLNQKIYRILSIGKQAGLFNPLEFFDQLYDLYSFIKANKSRPFKVEKKLNEISLTDAQKLFLFSYLAQLLYEDIEKKIEAEDEELNHCQLLVETDLAKLQHPDKDPIAWIAVLRVSGKTPSGQNKFDFYRVKKLLATLPDNKARIRYLVKIKTEYLQLPLVRGLDELAKYGEGFDYHCDLEIAKLEKLVALEQASQPTDEAQIEAQAELTNRNPEFTTARQVLAIHYLLKYSKVDQASNADVARFIEFLTGKNYKNIYKRVCNPLGSRDKELNEDLRFIRDFFEKLGLTEIVKMINNEINSVSF